MLCIKYAFAELKVATTDVWKIRQNKTTDNKITEKKNIEVRKKKSERNAEIKIKMASVVFSLGKS